MIPFEFILVVQLLWIAASLRWFLRRNDEVPILINLLLFYVSSFRYLVVTAGFSGWVNAAPYGYRRITDHDGLISVMYIALGQSLLSIAYMSAQRRKLANVSFTSDRQIAQWLRPRVFTLAFIAIPLSLLSTQAFSEQAARSSAAFGANAYLSHFPMILVGLSCLLIGVWKFGGLGRPEHKVIGLAFLAAFAYFTFSTSTRFMFLGWMVAAVVIVAADQRPQRRLVTMMVLTIATLTVFSAARVVRYHEVNFSRTYRRLAIAEDGNMADGFALLRQVCPSKLEYRMGREHLNILTRPIPRSIWPDKPVGGFMNQLGLYKRRGGRTLGFSPSIFGTFYFEGGVPGLVLFSILYGALLGWVISLVATRTTFVAVLIRAIICASLIALLRGGDLAVSFAWIGMSYWPIALFFWYGRDRLFRRRVPRHRGRMIHDTRVASRFRN